MDAIVLAALIATAQSPVHAPMTEKPQQLALLCIKSGERSSGMNKICYYDCAGSAAAITVGIAELCPLTINN